MSVNALNISNALNHKIAIIGLGYVGLPLAVEFGKKYDVVGFDIKAERIHALRMGQDETMQTDAAEITAAKKLQFSSDINDIKDCSILLESISKPITLCFEDNAKAKGRPT